MSNTIRREVLFPQPPEQVWQAITDRATLAEWMYPNDFEPRVGHRFTFQVPPNPKVRFDGLTVRLRGPGVRAPSRLVFSWSVAGPVANTQVSYRLEPDGRGTRLLFEHAGFDLSQVGGDRGLQGSRIRLGHKCSASLPPSSRNGRPMRLRSPSRTEPVPAPITTS